MWNTDLSKAPHSGEIWLRVEGTSTIYRAHMQSSFQGISPAEAHAPAWCDEYNREITGEPIAWAPVQPPPI